MFCLCYRTAIAQTEEEGIDDNAIGREATEDGVHRQSTGTTQARVRLEQVPYRGATPVAGSRTGAQRVADQDMVPEQARQDEEGQRRSQPAGAATHGAGTLQSFLIIVVDVHIKRYTNASPLKCRQRSNGARVHAAPSTGLMCRA